MSVWLKCCDRLSGQWGHSVWSLGRLPLILLTCVIPTWGIPCDMLWLYWHGLRPIPLSDMLHVLCVVTLISHASILITIPDFKLARHKCQCFKFRGYFTNYCSNKLHSTNVKGSHSIIFQSGLQCYEWQLISQQTQEAIIDCGKNMFMSIIFYWQSFIFFKYHRK